MGRRDGALLERLDWASAFSFGVATSRAQASARAPLRLIATDLLVGRNADIVGRRRVRRLSGIAVFGDVRCGLSVAPALVALAGDVLLDAGVLRAGLLIGAHHCSFE